MLDHGTQGKAFRVVVDTLGGGVPAEDQTRQVFAALRDAGFVCAPVEPTEEMVKEAWAAALDEDAGGVWHCMVEVAARGRDEVVRGRAA